MPEKTPDPDITFTVTSPDVNAMASLVELLDSVGCLGDEDVDIDTVYRDGVRRTQISVTLPMRVIETHLANLYAEQEAEQ